ncbi:MAG: DNA polymerase III subunit delta [Crocinitomicaceae bacterium]|nr:DNA polymerase III subunit delta [Crocinitomicaceae bacterium]
MLNVKDIIKSIQNKEFNAIYLLHGEEPYYIDKITALIQENALEEQERDFNQTVVYGKDLDLIALLGQLKQYPMMAERQLVILKEAQDIKDWTAIEPYLSNPVATTVFVICHKHKKADTRKKYVKANQQSKGILFESKKLYENQLDGWVNSFLKQKDFYISPKASTLLIEAIGSDLSRLAAELEKLTIVLQKGTTINEIHIEENIGISKDYNPFELANAIAKRDIEKSFKIISYFEKNPKAAHITMLIPNIYNLFERLMKIHFMNIRDANQLQSALKVNFYVAKEMMQAMQIYKPKKIAANISLLHEYDLKSKGVNRGSASDADLLRELVYQLTH